MALRYNHFKRPRIEDNTRFKTMKFMNGAISAEPMPQGIFGGILGGITGGVIALMQGSFQKLQQAYETKNIFRAIEPLIEIGTSAATVAKAGFSFFPF